MTSETNTTVPATISQQAVAARGASPVFDFDSFLTEAGYVAAKQVTRTVLQQVEGVPIAIRFDGPAYQGEELQQGKGSGVKMAPARLANITNLIDGQAMSLIMNTVLEGELLRAYGGEADGTGDKTPGYVGKSFAIRSHKPVDAEGKAKRYRVYQIIELKKKDETPAETIDADGVIEPVADGSDPVNRKGKAPKA